MALGIINGGMPPELGDVLLGIAAFALGVFFAMFYSMEIAAGFRRLLQWLRPSPMLTRCRQWLSAHKASH